MRFCCCSSLRSCSAALRLSPTVACALPSRTERIDPRGPLLGLDGRRPEYEPQHDEEDASEDRREEQHLAFALPFELRRRVAAWILVFCHNGLRFKM